jgi:hypothetical protein
LDGVLLCQDCVFKCEHWSVSILPGQEPVAPVRIAPPGLDVSYPNPHMICPVHPASFFCNVCEFASNRCSTI